MCSMGWDGRDRKCERGGWLEEGFEVRGCEEGGVVISGGMRGEAGEGAGM